MRSVQKCSSSGFGDGGLCKAGGDRARPAWRATAMALGAVAFLAAACGSTTAAKVSSSGAPASAASSSGSKKAPQGAGSATVLKTGTVTLAGKPVTVLTDLSGYTLYYLSLDTSTTAKCTAKASPSAPHGCTKLWPPLLLAAGAPKSSAALSGKLTAVTDANGRQVQYNGHFLYRYAGDAKPGQANGQNFLKVWHVATPSLAAGSPAAAASSGYSSSSSSGSSGSSGSSSGW